MNGITINGLQYILETISVSIANGIPNINLQFNIFVNGVLTRSYGIALQGEIAKNFLRSASTIIAAYEALIKELNEDITVPTTVESEILEPIDNADILYNRRKYLELTQQLCALAGIAYTGKLSNVDYESALNLASSNVQTGIIAAGLVYYRTCLRELEGPLWWDNIGDAK